MTDPSAPFITEKPRFFTREDAVAYASGNDLHVGFYAYSVKGGFFFVTDSMEDFDQPNLTHIVTTAKGEQA